VARVLETHTKAIDLEDDNAREEYEAYVELVERHRRIAAQPHALSERMASHRDLPMGRHDVEALSSPEAVDVFEQLVTLEQELRWLLDERLEQHRPLLSELRGAAGA